MHLLQFGDYTLSKAYRWPDVEPHRHPRVDYEKLSDDRLGEPLANVQARVDASREIQRERFGAMATHTLLQPIACNADMSDKKHRHPPNPVIMPVG